MPTAAENKAATQRMFAAFGESPPNIAAILEQASPDIVMEDFFAPTSAQEAGMLMLQKRSGVEGWAEFFKAMGETLQFNKFEVVRFLADEDTVIVYLQINATVKATGKSYEMTELVEFVFDEAGKVKGFRHHMDTAAFIAAHTP